MDWSVVVDQIRRGDPAGEEALYQNLQSGARLFLRRRLGTAEVDDKVHDLFLTVVEAIRSDQIREPERLMGFVRTILYRQLNLEISRLVQNRDTLWGIEEASHISGSAPSPEQEAANQQKMALMKQVLREMRGKDFEILTRSYIGEQSQERICKDMGITPPQFQVLKSRAKARLFELMQRKLKRGPLNQQ